MINSSPDLMALERILTACGGAIFGALGMLHLVYTLLDLRRPRRFAPADDAVRLAMQATTVRLARGRLSMWDAWMGFNISHSLGAIVFGAVAILVAKAGSQALLVSALPALAAVSAIYLGTAVRFWFYAPITGAAMATAAFVGAWLLVL